LAQGSTSVNQTVSIFRIPPADELILALNMLAQRRLLSKAVALILAACACRLASRGVAGSAFAPSAATLAAPARAAADRAAAERDADAMMLEDALRGAEAAASSASRGSAGSTFASSAAMITASAADRSDTDARMLEDVLRSAEAAASLASRGGAGAAFAPSAATLAAPARAVDDRTDAERDADTRELEDALRGAEAAAGGRRNSELEPRLQSGGKFAEAVPETALNPPWATCYVEAQLTTKSVIEEWIIRGESEVIDSFSAWRRSSQGAGSIKCVDISTEDALQAECLECALTFDVSAEGMLTLTTGPSDCMESAARGHGFCKSGELLLG